MALAERLAATLAQGALTQSDTVESGTDRVGALAFSGRLGAALVRLRMKADAADGKTALVILARRVQRQARGTTYTFAKRIAGAALAEWMHSHCKTCDGSGSVVSGAKVVGCCQTCNGTGTRRFTDGERRRALGLDADKPVPRRVAAVYDPIVGDCETAYRDALRRVRYQLHGD